MNRIINKINNLKSKKAVNLIVFSFLVILAGALIYIEGKDQLAKTPSCFGIKTADAQTCYGSLQEALSAAGNQYAVLIIPTGESQVSSNTTVGENITLKFQKGGLLNLAAGATLILNGEIEAGTHKIFSGAGRVRFHPKVEVNPVWFTSAGDGSLANPWVGPSGQGGIGEAIGRVEGAKIFRVADGHYRVTETINITSSGVAIVGMAETLTSEGESMSHISFEPSSSKVLFNFDDNNSSNGTLNECSLIGVSLSSNGGAHTAVRVVDSHWFVMRDVKIKPWYGTAIDWRGREVAVFDRIEVEADAPVVINKNPRYSSIDCDSVVFRDLSLKSRATGSESAVVAIANGVNLNFLTFEGTQKWQGARYGLYWNDTSSTAESSHLKLVNVRTSGANPSDGYFAYLKRNAILKNVTFEDCDGSDRGGGFAYMRNLETIYLAHSRYNNSGKYIDALGCYSIDSESANLSDTAQINIPDMTKKWSISGASGSNNAHGIWLRNPQ